MKLKHQKLFFLVVTLILTVYMTRDICGILKRLQVDVTFNVTDKIAFITAAGDLLINVICLVYVCYTLIKYTIRESRAKKQGIRYLKFIDNLSDTGWLFFYYNVGRGLNVLKKKKKVIYIVRFGLHRKGDRIMFRKISMKRVAFVILLKNKYLGDVLAIQIGKRETLILTPVNPTFYDLTERATELSLFLDVPLIVTTD